MDTLYIILLAILAIWAIFICTVIRRYIVYFTKVHAMEDPAIAEKNDCFRRNDMAKWSHLEMYFCGIFFLPVRVVFFLVGLLICTILVKIILIGYNHKKEMGIVRRTILKGVTRTATRFCLFNFGFYWINNVKVNIHDVDPSYPADADQNVPAPLVVCNHVSWNDIFIHMASQEAPGFMAKSSVANYPGVGSIAKGIGSLFVKRDSQTGRDDVVVQLKERLEKVKNFPKTTPKVLVFPEGTTSNGEWLLSMKKGAFFQLTPVKLNAIKYHATRFSPAYDSIGILAGFVLTLSQFYNGVTVYDMGVYNPEHLNLKNEEDWPIYAAKVKGILQNVLKVKSCELGFADKTEYETYVDNLLVKPKINTKKNKHESPTTDCSPMLNGPQLSEILVSK